MKRLILIIIAALAIHVGIQAQAPAEPTIQVGDSVMVNPDTTHYMTGEEIAPWVYTVKHAIQQVGSAFHPDGVLLQGIISWLHQSALLIDGTKPAAKEVVEKATTTKQETVVEEIVTKTTDQEDPPEPEARQNER